LHFLDKTKLSKVSLPLLQLRIRDPCQHGRHLPQGALMPLPVLLLQMLAGLVHILRKDPGEQTISNCGFDIRSVIPDNFIILLRYMDVDRNFKILNLMLWLLDHTSYEIDIKCVRYTCISFQFVTLW
jgi:hypothetical protein